MPISYFRLGDVVDVVDVNGASGGTGIDMAAAPSRLLPPPQRPPHPPIRSLRAARALLWALL